MDQLKINLENQLMELESLQAVFCNPGEIRIEDPLILAEINDFISGKLKYIPSCLDLSINLMVENKKIEIDVSLPHEYPSECSLEVFVRNSDLKKSQHKKINNDLKSYISTLEKGEQCIFSVVTWVQENCLQYVESQDPSSQEEVEKDTSLSRFWIYSHHIYSITKRREILSLANSLKLTGFCLPGKPGIICVEGRTIDCNEWWQDIKSMTWKRIFCKISEDAPNGDETFLKFNTFEEIGFQNSKNNHMDMGELQKFMESHNCGGVFKDLFDLNTEPNK